MRPILGLSANLHILSANFFHLQSLFPSLSGALLQLLPQAEVGAPHLIHPTKSSSPTLQVLQLLRPYAPVNYC